MTDRLHECLAPNAAAVLIHALNPFGFSWLRRCNEDNVDLNRNFLDFQQAIPSAHAYEEIHSLLVPATWKGEARALADLELKKFIEARGVRALQDAAQPGQYSRPDGLFFGGARPIWSNRIFWTILQDCYIRSAIALRDRPAHGTGSERARRGHPKRGRGFPNRSSEGMVRIGFETRPRQCLRSSLARCSKLLPGLRRPIAL